MVRKTLKKRGGQQNQINSIQEIVNIITTKDPTPENQQRIISFLETNPGFKEYVTLRGESLLILSIKYDMPAVFYKLLEIGADVNLQDSSGRTALMYVAYNGYINRVNKLLELGSPPAHNALNYASSLLNRHYAPGPKLGVDVNIQDKAGHTALMYAEDNLRKLDPSSNKVEIYTNIIQSLQRYQQLEPEITGRSNFPQMQVEPERTGRESTQYDKPGQLNATRDDLRKRQISEQRRELEPLKKENDEMQSNLKNSGSPPAHNALNYAPGPNSGTASDYLKQLQEKTKQIKSDTAEIEKRTENARKNREEEENSKSKEEKNADAEYDELTLKLRELVIKNGHDSDNVEIKKIKNQMNEVQEIRAAEQQKRRDPLGLTSNSQFKYRFGDVKTEGDVSENGIREIGQQVKDRLGQPIRTDYSKVTEDDLRRGGKSRKRQISRTSKTRKSNGKTLRKNASRKQMEIKQMARKKGTKKSRRSIKKR